MIYQRSSGMPRQNAITTQSTVIAAKGRSITSDSGNTNANTMGASKKATPRQSLAGRCDFRAVAACPARCRFCGVAATRYALLAAAGAARNSFALSVVRMTIPMRSLYYLAIRTLRTSDITCRSRI